MVPNTNPPICSGEQEFYCYVNGRSDEGVQKILIPTVCCGINIKLHNKGGGDYPSTFATCCLHMGTYSNIWRIFRKYKVKVPISNGMNCSLCPFFGHMAGPNQPDGSFKCWSCRNRW